MMNHDVFSYYKDNFLQFHTSLLPVTKRFSEIIMAKQICRMLKQSRNFNAQGYILFFFTFWKCFRYIRFNFPIFIPNFTAQAQH